MSYMTKHTLSLPEQEPTNLTDHRGYMHLKCEFVDQVDHRHSNSRTRAHLLLTGPRLNCNKAVGVHNHEIRLKRDAAAEKKRMTVVSTLIRRTSSKLVGQSFHRTRLQSPHFSEKIIPQKYRSRRCGSAYPFKIHPLR